MPKINIADVENLMEQEEEGLFEDRREKLREKEAKNRFKENREDDE